MKKLTFTHTLGACFTGYIVQAIVNLFAPLLFVTFGNLYGIPLSGITLLITLNFAIQLTVDLMGTFIVDKMGYKATAIAANFTAAAGLILLSFLPDLIDPYASKTIIENLPAVMQKYNIKALKDIIGGAHNGK